MKINYFHFHNFYDNLHHIFYILQALILSPNSIFHNMIFTVWKFEMSWHIFISAKTTILNMDFQ